MKAGGSVKSRHNLSFSRQTGTPLYTAPEQASDLFYNERTDVYTLGIILFEMLSNFKTMHRRIDKIMMLKDKGQIEESFKNQYPCEAALILKLTERVNDDRPKCWEIFKLKEFEDWVKELSTKLNLDKSQTVIENKNDSLRVSQTSSP